MTVATATSAEPVDGLESIYGPVPPPARLTYSPKALIDHFADEEMGLRELARRLQVDPAMLCRPLSSTQADRYATRMGVHPAEVWGADFLRPHRPPPGPGPWTVPDEWLSPAARFWRLVGRGSEADCWPWLGEFVRAGGRRYPAHRPTRSQTVPAVRVAFELVVGALEVDERLDRQCSTEECVNPWHHATS